MAQAHATDLIQNSLQKTDQWLTDFSRETGRDDSQKAWAMFRAVLHVLRDRLTLDQTAHLSAQLPLVLRGLYFEGWRPSDQPMPLRTRDQFIQAVAEQLSGHPEIDPNQAVAGVFKVLGDRITRGELDKIRNMLQPELQALWPQD